MTDWTYVRDDIGTEDVSCAISLDGTTVYVADRADGVVRSLPFPSLAGGGTTVYTEPSGYELNGVTDTPDGPLVILDDESTFTTAEVRDFADNVIHTTAGVGSSRGYRLVWNPVVERLYVLRAVTGSGDHTLYSMLNDGSDVQTEFASGAGIGLFSQRHGVMVTSDGAFWFTSATPPGRRATRIFEGVETIGTAGTTRFGLAHVPDDLVKAYQSVDFGDTVLVEEEFLTDSPVTTAFDGNHLLQSSVTPDFTRGVAVAIDDFSTPEWRWYVFEARRPRWWAGVAGWS